MWEAGAHEDGKPYHGRMGHADGKTHRLKESFVALGSPVYREHRLAPGCPFFRFPILFSRL